MAMQCLTPRLRKKPPTIAEFVRRHCFGVLASYSVGAAISLDLYSPEDFDRRNLKVNIWTISTNLEDSLKEKIGGEANDLFFSRQASPITSARVDRDLRIIYYIATVVPGQDVAPHPLMMILYSAGESRRAILNRLKSSKRIRKQFKKNKVLLALRVGDHMSLGGSQPNEVSVMTTGSSLGRDACGAEVQNESSGCYATLGGVVQVDQETRLGLTANHVFSEPMPHQRKPSSIALYDSSFSIIGMCETTEAVASSPGRALSETATSGAVKREPVRDDGISSKITIRAKLASSSMDCALVEAANPDASSSSTPEPVQLKDGINEVRHNNEKSLFPTRIAETPPRDSVLVATRRGALPASGAGLNIDPQYRSPHRRDHLARLLPFRSAHHKQSALGDRTGKEESSGDATAIEELWMIQLHAGSFIPGDSGSWVVDLNSGDLYGMLVYANLDLGQGYLIPAKRIFSEMTMLLLEREERGGTRLTKRLQPGRPQRNTRIDLPSIQHSLFYAVDQDDLDLLRRLLASPTKSDLRVDEPDRSGRYALVEAVRQGNRDVVNALLDFGADINAPVRGPGGNALYTASAAGDVRMLELLLQRRPDMNAETGLMKSALCAAAGNGHEALVRILLQHGANPIKPADALHAASQGGRKEIVELLLDLGVSQERWFDALHAASKEGHDATVRLLVSQGPESAILDSFAQGAFSERHYSIVEFLLEKGASLDIEDPSAANAALCVAIEEDYEALIGLLLDDGGPLESFRREMLNKVWKDWHTPLMVAISKSKGHFVRRLLQSGADPNKQLEDPETRGLMGSPDMFSTTGDTPISLAVTSKNTDILNTLLDYGAKVNDGLDHTSLALFLASSVGNLEFVRILLSKEANAESTGPQGLYRGTSLSVAASRGYTEIVELLIQKGADPKGPPGHIHPFCRPLPAALRSEKGETAVILLEHGADAVAAIVCFPPWQRSPANKAMRELLQKYVDGQMKSLLGDEKHEGDWDKFMGRFKDEWDEVQKNEQLSPS